MCRDVRARRATAKDSAAVAERRLESASVESSEPLGTWLTSSNVTRTPVLSAAAFTRSCTADSGSELPTVPAIGSEWVAASLVSPESWPLRTRLWRPGATYT